MDAPQITSEQATVGASPWLTVEQCLLELNIPRSTWEKWRQRGRAPRAKRLPNGQLRIHRECLDRWLNDLPEQA